MDAHDSHANSKRHTIFPPIDLKWYESAPLPPKKIQTTNPQSSPSKSQQIETQLNHAKSQAIIQPRSHKTSKLQHQNPWSHYQKAIYLDDNKNYIGAYSLQKQGIVRMIICCPGQDDDWLENLITIRHKHIVPLYEVFQHNNAFLVYEIMHISLETMIACNLAFKEPQVAKVCAEV